MRRDDTTATPITPTTNAERPCSMWSLVLNDLDRHDPTVRALTAQSDGKPLPPVPSGLR